MYIHEQNSLCHCSNFAVWSCLPRGPLEISSLSSKQIETSRGTGIRANLWLRATSTGTDQLTASRVTFSVALFRGTRRPFSSSLFVCLCFALSLSLLFSSFPLFLCSPLSLLRSFPLSFLLFVPARPFPVVSQFSVREFFAPSCILSLSASLSLLAPCPIPRFRGRTLRSGHRRCHAPL